MIALTYVDKLKSAAMFGNDKFKVMVKNAIED